MAQRLCLTSLSHLRDRRARRILTLAGYRPTFGLPREGDAIAVWGHRKTAKRGETLAARSGVPLIRMEDAFLRGLTPGRAGGKPIGLILDKTGIYYDASGPSDLEAILRDDPLDHTDLLSRARAGIDLLKSADLTKFTAYDPEETVPDPGYVLVVDQTRDDASIRLGGANALSFAEMLTAAQLDHPHARIVIKGHPEARMGLRPGHFGPENNTDRITYLDRAVSPWRLLEGAIAVYAVTSQLGFEAILAGHKPQIFGQPFYGGWGLSDDISPLQRRGRVLTRTQLFAAAMLKYPTWYDPCRDRLCRFEDAAEAVEAEARAWRQDHTGFVATGIRLWKRGLLSRFQSHGTLTFEDDPARAVAKATARACPVEVWTGKESDALRALSRDKAVPLLRIEDGFLRSKGLGAELIAPLSLVWDRSGIYYDPTRPNDLEALISAASVLSPDSLIRARNLRESIVAAGLTKYNLDRAGWLPELPPNREIILVPGQVEDDASILTGTGQIRTNLALLQATRARFPDAFLIYKPHPDVEAGLRAGALQTAPDADLIAAQSDPVGLLSRIDRVVTMTSLLGFEALLREKRVSTFGTPFYAGWGLTNDAELHPDAQTRRKARPSLDALVHATLIAYPRYFDPVSRRACAPEVVIDRLASGALPAPPPAHRLLAKAQGALASQSWIWR